MSQHMAEEDSSRRVVDFGDETVCVALNVEDRELVNRIRRGKHSSYLHQTLPLDFLGDAVPDIQGLTEIAVRSRRFQKLLATDDVHPAASKTIRFAFCEAVKRKFAKCELRPGIRSGCW